MGLIDKIILSKINRLSKKMMKLNFKLSDLEEERNEARENLIGTSFLLRISEKYYDKKIESTKQKISKVESSLVKNHDKYNERNAGTIFDMFAYYHSPYEDDINNL